ncbi:hypothetical protein [Pedobacter ginsengisoli]|uniref:hypothetical protein n=1 Tax=Pedobacter ginsengisoli TaxID=363852 RepID=UPI0025501000|nr:hypothetical protein [Pedobacter ginsengisoli]
MKFKTLEEAQAAFDAQELQLKDVQAALTLALKGKTDAEEIAEDALAKVGKYEAQLPKKFIGKLDKSEYEVLFGVDGYTKEDLVDPKNKKVLAELVKNSSGAVKRVED